MSTKEEFETILSIICLISGIILIIGVIVGFILFITNFKN